MNISKNLFWDVNEKEIDLDKYVCFVVSRVIEKGNIQDIKLILEHYGEHKVKKELPKTRYLGNHALSFYCALFELNKTDFRCYIETVNASTWVPLKPLMLNHLKSFQDNFMTHQ